MSGFDHRVISEFQRRRRRLLLNSAFSLVLFALALALVQGADTFPSLLGVSRRGWTAAAVAQLIAGVIFAVIGVLQYRCPVCNGIVRGLGRSPFGVVPDPDECPRCGVRLKG